jgi:hypothetical protein
MQFCGQWALLLQFGIITPSAAAGTLHLTIVELWFAVCKVPAFLQGGDEIFL